MSQTRITATTRTKDMPCRKCGIAITVGANTRNQPRHLECGIREGIDAMMQMRQKSGPYYDKWLQGMRNALAKEGRASGGG